MKISMPLIGLSVLHLQAIAAPAPAADANREARGAGLHGSVVADIIIVSTRIHLIVRTYTPASLARGALNH